MATKPALGVDKRRSIPWYEERELVDRRFGSWKRIVRQGGIRLQVSIMLDGNWGLLPRSFVFVYSDSQGSYEMLQVPRRLVRLENSEVLALAREYAARLNLGQCARCKRKGILDRTSPASRHVNLCESCFSAEVRAEQRAETRKLAALEKAERKAKAAQKKAQGYSYRLDLWIHPKRSGDDYCLERYFKSRPLRADIEALARRSGSAILDDYKVERL